MTRIGLRLLLVLLLMAAAITACATDSQGTFAVRLVTDDMPTNEFMAAPLETITLQETPLLSEDDLIGYDPVSHEIELTPAAYQRLQDTFPLPVDVDGIPFVVTVGDEAIYRGALWTPLSSLSFDGVVIMQPMGDERSVIGLALGYPSPQAFTGRDPRGDSRIVAALEAAGKMR